MEQRDGLNRTTWWSARAARVIALGLALPGVGYALSPQTSTSQESAPGAGATEEVRARVTTTRADTGILIDRGEADGLRVGDVVELRARGGAARTGRIVEVSARGAVVRPDDPEFVPGAGVRVLVRVPSARFEEPTPTPSPGGASTGEGRPSAPRPAGPGASAPDPAAPDPATPDPGARPDPEWSNADEDWTFDMPLLAEVGAVVPGARPRTWSGRSYLSFDQIFDTEDDRGDTFLRAGSVVRVDNAFGHGGRLEVDGEWNLRRAEFTNQADESDRTFRLDRLSYTSGGHRHDWSSWQVGRFLQRDMPELGILDGAAWSWRTEGGDSYGTSVGFLPEPDKDQQTGEDFQVAAWYRWVRDEAEDLVVTTGYQKTWHNGTRDRDLIVSRLTYAPERGWNVFGSLWLDLYGVGDNVKDSGPEVTLAVIDATRQIGERAGVGLDYRHQEYPELRRDDFPAVNDDALAEARVDRLSANSWRWLRERSETSVGMRAFGRVGAWRDEEDGGGDASLGLEFHGMFSARDRLDLAGFTSRGKFSGLQGGRVRYGRYSDRDAWSLLYELRMNDVLGFEIDADDFVQHRIRGSYELRPSPGVTASIYLEAQLQDTEDQVFLGLFLQRAF